MEFVADKWVLKFSGQFYFLLAVYHLNELDFTRLNPFSIRSIKKFLHIQQSCLYNIIAKNQIRLHRNRCDEPSPLCWSNYIIRKYVLPIWSEHNYISSHRILHWVYNCMFRPCILAIVRLYCKLNRQLYNMCVGYCGGGRDLVLH
jgi:hypothetical protein